MIQVKTKGGSDPHGKRRVFFACHPDDFDSCFTSICTDIFRTHDCAIFYTDDPVQPFEDINTDLAQINMFVIAVTLRLLTEPNYAADIILPFSQSAHVPLLPIMLEPGLDELYSRKFGELQYLDFCNRVGRNSDHHDPTTISYEDKLKKYLESVLISDQLARRIRSAFDAYVFLSYRKKDRKYANELMKQIHDDPVCRDIAIWYDEFLVPGESFNTAIEEALEKSRLFTLLVTPNLINEENYVHTVEYPAARKISKQILPVEMVLTDRRELARQYAGIPECSDLRDESFRTRFAEALSLVAKEENDTDDLHNFLIGLAYLDGIDVEKNTERGIALITRSAEHGLSEAIDKLVDMYHDGIGVPINWETCIKWLEAGVAAARKKYGTNNSTLRKRMKRLGILYYESGRYHEALEILEKVCRSEKKVFGKENETTLETLEYTASIYSAMGDFDKAIELLAEILTIREEEYGKSDIRTAATWEYIAGVFSLGGNYTKAMEILLNEVKDVYRKTYGETGKEYLRVMKKAFDLWLVDFEGPDQCRKLYGLYNDTLYKLYVLSYGKYHPETLDIIHSLAICENYLGESEEALKTLRYVYDNQIKVLGENSPTLCGTLRSIAIVYDSLGEYQKSLEYDTKAYELQRKLSGDNFPKTLTSLYFLGADHMMLGENDKALDIFTKVYNARKEILGDTHPDTIQALTGIAEIHRLNEDTDKALELLSEAYRLEKSRCVDPDEATEYESDDALDILTSMVKIYQENEEYEKALPLCRKVYEVLKPVRSDTDSPKLTDITKSLADIYSGLEDTENALPVYEELLERQKALLGEEDQDTIETMMSIAMIYDVMDRTKEALALMSKVYNYYSKTFGASDPVTMETARYIALLGKRIGKYKQSAALLEIVYNYKKRELGKDDPDTVETLEELEDCRSHMKSTGL